MKNDDDAVIDVAEDASNVDVSEINRAAMAEYIKLVKKQMTARSSATKKKITSKQKKRKRVLKRASQQRNRK